MNDREIGEIRRHLRRDRSNMTAIFGCFVNEKKEIITSFRQSTGIMPENEGDKYFALFRRVLSGAQGRNLIDISFKTSQVAGSPEHDLLMELRKSRLEDEETRSAFFRKIIDSVVLEGNYLILMGCDSYDVPFKGKDGAAQPDSSEETYTCLVCAVCPVKQTKATLHYVPEEKVFHDGAMNQPVAAPELGFLFPAFDDRSTNIYGALAYTRNTADNHEAFVQTVFGAEPPMAAGVQKETFEHILGSTLDEDCSIQVVQAVHAQFSDMIQEHKESRDKEPLVISKPEVNHMLKTCGLSEERIKAFDESFDENFGQHADLSPKNLVDTKKFHLITPDVKIQVAPDKRDLVETRVLGGVKYILIRAEEGVEVNGVNINF